MPRTGLSNEVKAKIIELRRAWHSMSQIAQILGITRGQVAGILHRAGEMKKKVIDASPITG